MQLSYDLNIIYVGELRISGNKFSETIELFRRQIFLNCMEYIPFKCGSNLFCFIVIWNICFLIILSCINFLVSGNAVEFRQTFLLYLTFSCLCPLQNIPFSFCQALLSLFALSFYTTTPSHTSLSLVHTWSSNISLTNLQLNYCRPPFSQAFQ